MLTRLKGGRVYDPANQVNGEITDIWFRDGVICAPPQDPNEADETFDVSGKIVMAGAIDIHSHIAGGNVNNARVMLPEQHLADRARYARLPFAGAKWSTFDTGYRYAEMGFTFVVEPAVLPINAAQAHAELADIPIIDKAGLAIVGNDDFLLRLLRDRADPQQVTDYVAWVINATQCLGVKVINAGGATAFKFNQRHLSLDEEVPMYGVSSRAILNAVQRAVVQLGIAHPVHVHCNNLGVAGNVQTALNTIDAADGLPMHLAHVQFYGYGDEGEKGFSSGASALADKFNANPNITMDVGQVLFGQTVTISGDVLRQFDARGLANPSKWVVWESEDGGGGIVPFKYRKQNFINALQWAIGLELFLLADDPWRLFFTTDHPNGAPFTAYPELFRLLMDREHRNRWLSEINAEAADICLLRHLDREYDLNDIAIMTRAAPARLLGLTDRGHLAPGGVADIAVYEEQDDKAAMFARAHLLFKDGNKVVENGRVTRNVFGKTHAIAPEYASDIERSITDYFDRYHLVDMHAFKLNGDQMADTLGSELVVR